MSHPQLEKIVNQVKEKEFSYNSYMKYDKQIEDISNYVRLVLSNFLILILA